MDSTILGVVLDSSIVIEAERQRLDVACFLKYIVAQIRRSMKHVASTALVALIGGIVGSLISTRTPWRAQAAPSEIRATGFVLTDGRNEPAARLGFVDGSPILQFYNSDSSVACRSALTLHVCAGSSTSSGRRDGLSRQWSVWKTGIPR